MNSLHRSVIEVIKKRRTLTVLGVATYLAIDVTQARAAVAELLTDGFLDVEYDQGQQPVYRVVKS